MGSIKAFRPHSIGQYIITLSLIFGAQSGLSQSKDKDKKSSKDKKEESSSNSSNEIKTSSGFRSGGVATNNVPDKCDTLRSELARSRRDFSDACGSAGLGGFNSCYSKIQRCSDAALGSSGTDSDDISREFSRALGVPINKVSSSCPKYSGQGYFERKDKYDREIKDTNDDLAKIKEETAELKEKFAEDVNEVQEDIAKAQEEYNEKVLKSKESKREEDMALAKNAAETAEKIRNAETTIMMKRQEINNLYATQNSQLIIMNDAALVSACRKKVLDVKAEYLKLMGKSTGSGSEYFRRASEKKKVLQAEWDSCRAQFQVQRKAVVEQNAQKVEQAEKVIRDTQSQVDDLKQVLATMSSQATEASTDRNTALTDAQKGLQEKIGRATAKLQSMQQTTEEKAKALAEKQQFYQQNSQKLNVAVANLGPVPDDESSTKKISEVSSKYDEYLEAEAQAKAGFDSDGNRCATGSAYSSTSSSSSKKSRGSSKGEE